MSLSSPAFNRPESVVDAEFTTAIEYDGSNNVLYLGKARPGTSKGVIGWQIQKMTYSGSNLTDVQYASGSADFNSIWNNRASYSYS